MAGNNAAYAQWAQGIIDQYEGKISKMLGLPVPEDKKIVVVPLGDPRLAGGGAHYDYDASTIYVTEEYATKQSEGMLVHEITHAFMIDAGANDKKAEVIPDWVRFKLGLNIEPNGDVWDAGVGVENFDRRTAAEVKNWVGGPTGVSKPPPENDNFGSDGASDIGSIRGDNPLPGSVKPTDDPPDGYEYVQNEDGVWVPVPIGGDGDGNKSHRAERNLKATYSNTVLGYGIAINSEIQSIINQAAGHGMSLEAFMAEFRQTDEYAERFVGIMNKDGSLKMDESTYLSYEKQYETYASRAGYDLSSKQMGYLFRNDVTPEESSDRFVGLGRIDRNKDLYKAFGRELVQGGLAKPKDVDTKAEMFKFVMGEGNKKWYDLWQDTVTRNAAVQAGLTFKKAGESYTNLRQGMIEKISGMDLTEDEMASKFMEVADMLGGAYIPGTTSGIAQTTAGETYGVTKQAVAKAVFGGKGSVRARQKIGRAVRTDEAFYDERATEGFEVETDRKQQSSEY
jgi:hypothetical protein